MQYRREIDGLRAIAVLPVILFHAGFTLFSGGFVGVDVFFVISGYLITGKLIADLDRGSFSLVRFYEGRARRILPALSLVVLCCIPFAWQWLTPLQLHGFFDSLAAVTLFASNIQFWREAGYFAPVSELKPLLHTWSLAIEEQYYLLFPVALLVAWRFGRKAAFWCIVAAAVVSLVLCIWAPWRSPTAAFYLAPTRAWELLAGSICAFLAHGRPPRAGNIVSLAGLVLVALPIFAFDSQTPFPGPYALAPVGGTALILLYGGPGTLAARLLSIRALVGVGLVSYSAYLWHWPLLAFARLRSMGEPEAALKIALAASSLGLAALSWKFVEQPFRKRGQPPLRTRRAVFAASLATVIAFLSAGVAGHLSDGAPFRIAPSGKSFASRIDENRLWHNPGLGSECERQISSSKCRTGDHPQLALWGDSFAMHLAGALRSSRTSVPFVQMAKSSCAPILGIAIEAEWSRWRDCIQFNDTAFRRIVASRDVKVVVMSSTFRIMETEYFDRLGKRGQNDHDNIAHRQLLRTIDRLRAAGKTVVIVSPTPRVRYNIGNCLVTAEVFGVSRERCDFSKAEYADETRTAYRFLKGLSRRVPVVWLDALICRENVCRASIDDVFSLRQGSHLTEEGSAYLGRKYDLMGRIYQAAGAQPPNLLASKETEPAAQQAASLQPKRTELSP